MSNTMAEFDDGPVIIPWTVTSEDDWQKTFTVKVNGIAQDVSAWEWQGAITVKRNDDDPVASLVWDVTNAADGIVTYKLDYPTTDVPRGTYWYELKLKAPGRRTWQAGPLDVLFSHSEMT